MVGYMDAFFETNHISSATANFVTPHVTCNMQQEIDFNMIKRASCHYQELHSNDVVIQEYIFALLDSIDLLSF